CAKPEPKLFSRRAIAVLRPCPTPDQSRSRLTYPRLSLARPELCVSICVPSLTGTTVDTHHMPLPDDISAIDFEYAPIGLLLTENRVIKGCNPAFAQMFGYNVEDLLEQSFAMLYPSIEEFEPIRNVGVEPLKRTNRYSDERIMARQDGTLFLCRVRGHSLTL